MDFLNSPYGLSLLAVIPRYPVAVVCLLLCLAGLAFIIRCPALSPKVPALIEDGYPIVGAVHFWIARWEFFPRAQAQSSSGNFSYFIGKHPVLGVSSDEARRVIFESKQLGPGEAYILLGD
jgi:hypothetical protein